ncbi:MAG: hypothetical protein INR64_19120 [Caulobacteraceae bacterium]|nr:hypothetical protein [Caulobacter sp.]
MIRSFRSAAVAAVAGMSVLGLAACESDLGPGRYSPYEAGVPARVETGRVVSFRPIRFSDTANVNGATTVGAVGGGALGASLGGDAAGSIGGGIIGAVVGGVLGHEIAKGGDRQGFAYVIRMDDGHTIEVPQAQPYPIPAGARVNVIFGPRVRIEPVGQAYYGPPPPPPPPRY